MTLTIRVGNAEFGSGRLVLVAGPCVLESLDLGLEIAETVRDLCDELGFGYIFKSSFDKANRTSIVSYRGPGIELGLEWLEKIRQQAGVPVLTDIHEAAQAPVAAEVVDILQIPAFLCRQTDLLVAAARTGRVLNVKKAQFMAPEDMTAVLSKCLEAGNDRVILCERGTSFGYHQLVVDMRSLAIMRSLGCPSSCSTPHTVSRPPAAREPRAEETGGLSFRWPGRRWRWGSTPFSSKSTPTPTGQKATVPTWFPWRHSGLSCSKFVPWTTRLKKNIGMTDLEWVVKSGYGQPS